MFLNSYKKNCQLRKHNNKSDKNTFEIVSKSHDIPFKLWCVLTFKADETFVQVFNTFFQIETSCRLI